MAARHRLVLLSVPLFLARGSLPEVASPAPLAVSLPAVVSLARAPAFQPSAGGPELFSRYPSLRRAVSHVSLGSFPTPIEGAGSLAERLGIGALYVKRDDLSSSAYGGSKVRKLEFLLGEARARGAELVVTTGSAGSNQAVATAVHARALGIDALLLLAPEAPSDHVRQNLLLSAEAGAELRAVPSVSSAVSSLARLTDRKHYFIEPGGSSELGTLGFVNAGLELAEQVRAGKMPRPDYVYVALGTMGSAVGLCIGFKLARLDARIVAVRASNPETSSPRRFHSLFANTVKYLRKLDPELPVLELGPRDVRIAGGQLGAGYARPTRAAREAAELFAGHTGAVLETTYTGKAFAQLIADAPELSDAVVVFWNSHASEVRAPPPGLYRALPAAFRDYFHRSGRGGGTRGSAGAPPAEPVLP
jgi:D-cysteine desulfhydrase